MVHAKNVIDRMVQITASCMDYDDLSYDTIRTDGEFFVLMSELRFDEEVWSKNQLLERVADFESTDLVSFATDVWDELDAELTN